jgi:hypothetical protein
MTETSCPHPLRLDLSEEMGGRLASLSPEALALVSLHPGLRR